MEDYEYHVRMAYLFKYESHLAWAASYWWVIDLLLCLSLDHGWMSNTKRVGESSLHTHQNFIRIHNVDREHFKTVHNIYFYFSSYYITNHLDIILSQSLCNNRILYLLPEPKNNLSFLVFNCKYFRMLFFFFIHLYFPTWSQWLKLPKPNPHPQLPTQSPLH